MRRDNLKASCNQLADIRNECSGANRQEDNMFPSRARAGCTMRRATTISQVSRKIPSTRVSERSCSRRNGMTKAAMEARSLPSLPARLLDVHAHTNTQDLPTPSRATSGNTGTPNGSREPSPLPPGHPTWVTPIVGLTPHGEKILTTAGRAEDYCMCSCRNSVGFCCDSARTTAHACSARPRRCPKAKDTTVRV